MHRYYVLINFWIQGLALFANALSDVGKSQWALLPSVVATVWLIAVSRKLPWAKYISVAAIPTAVLFLCSAVSVTWQPLWWLLTAITALSFVLLCIRILKLRDQYSMDVAIVGLTIPMLYPYVAALRIPQL